MSNHETNKVVRVLTGKRLKFTVRVHRLSGDVVEFQTDFLPKLEWNHETRGLTLIMKGSTEVYDTFVVMEWETGMVMTWEANPETA